MTEAYSVPRKVRSIWPPLLLLAASVGYVVWAQDYSRVPRMMPTIVGGFTAFLCVLDFLSRLDNRLGAALSLTLGADFRSPEMTHDPSLGRESAIIAVMVACVLSMLVIGILPTVPLFIALYMRFWGARPWLASLISAAVVLAFVVAVFEVVLDYELYRGVLFDPRGFDSW